MNIITTQEEKISNFLKRQEAVNFYSIVSSLVIIILILTIFALNYTKLPAQIPLFYSLPWGEEQLVALPQFIILPSIIALVILVNLVISWHLHESQTVLKRFLSVSTSAVSLLILFAALRIIYTFV